jgi:hypothetical protein
MPRMMRGPGPWRKPHFTYAQLLYWHMISDMIVPGSSYLNIAFGWASGEAEKDVEGVKTVERFAENLAWLAGRIGEPGGA